MPELPEVEALCRFLDERLAGQTIERLEILGISTLKTVSPSPADLHGREIETVWRRGKFLVTSAPPLSLVVHLSRAGWIQWHDILPARSAALKSKVAVRLSIEGGAGITITEAGHEKRLAAYVVQDLMEVPGIARLGIDALDEALDPALLGRLVHGAGGAHLKTVLADQSVIAGIGNAYSDEILHAARLSPFQPAARLDDDAVARLHAAVREVMSAAIDATSGLTPSQLKDGKRATLRIHNHTGEPCPVCGTTIRMVDMGTKTFQYCPGCQTGGRIYADRRMSRLLR